MAIGALEEEKEVPGLLERKVRGGDGKRSSKLLVGGEPEEALEEGHAEELLGERLAHLGVEALEDREPPFDPEPSSSERLGDGPGAHAVAPLERAEKVELLAERRPSPGVVASEALDAGLGAAPGLDDGPGLLLAAFLEAEEAPEAVDKQEASLPVLGDEERVVGVDRALRPVTERELERDRLERDPAETHRSLRGGRERTWKVG